MKGVAKDSNSRMIKIINRLVDSGFAKVEFREVTPCELFDKVVYNHIVEVYGLEDNSDNREMLMDLCESVQYLTTLKTPRGDKNYVTLQVPLFEVCGGPKLISSADKKDPHCAWVGEYIKVRSDALGKKPLYISLGDVMQRGRRAIDANLCHIFSTENPKNNWAYNFIRGGSRSGGKKYRMEHYGCSLDPIDVLSKLSAFTEQPTGDADAFRDITNGMYDTFKAKNHDYGNSFAELFKECGMTYAYGHMAEKLKRVKSLMSDEAKVKGESMKDSLLDLANYAILTIMELDKTRK